MTDAVRTLARQFQLAGTLAARQDLVVQAWRAGMTRDEINQARLAAGLNEHFCFPIPATENDNERPSQTDR